MDRLETIFRWWKWLNGPGKLCEGDERRGGVEGGGQVSGRAGQIIPWEDYVGTSPEGQCVTWRRGSWPEARRETRRPERSPFIAYQNVPIRQRLFPVVKMCWLSCFPPSLRTH